MELRYPIILVIGLLIIIGLVFLNLKKKDSYEKGKKVANTQYVKENPYYQEILKKYKYLTYLIQGTCIFSILMSFILLARPSKVDTKNDPNYARDIFLCMDVSASVDELNMKLVDRLKQTVNKLKGERIGISIFNTSSILVSPLTDDYEYINSRLDTIHESLRLQIEGDANLENWWTRQYIVSGTIVGADVRGSSLIGDGLASCVYHFSNLEENRSRIIIFSTDNDLAGDEIITLQEAANLCKSKNIIVYGLAPELIEDDKKDSFKQAVELTGGKYYTMTGSTTVKDIVDNIEKTSKSLIKGPKETKKIDKPLIPFLMLTISVGVLLVLDKKVNI